MKGKEGWNYFRLGGPSLLYRHYLYFDRDQCSFSLIRRRNIRMSIKRAMQHRQEKYVMVECRVRKKDAGEFEAAMEELPNKMLICGYRDYGSFCDRLSKEIAAIQPEKKSQKAGRESQGHNAD